MRFMRLHNSCIISKGLISLGYKIPLRGSTPTRFRQFSSRLACPPCRFSRPSQYRRSEGTFVLAKRRFLSYAMTPSPPPPPHHTNIFLPYSHREQPTGRRMDFECARRLDCLPLSF